MQEGQASYAHVNGIVDGLRRRGWRVRLVDTVPPRAGRFDALRRLAGAAGTQVRYWLERGDFLTGSLLYVRLHFLTLPTALLARWSGATVIQEVNGVAEDAYDLWPALRRLDPLNPLVDRGPAALGGRDHRGDRAPGRARRRGRRPGGQRPGRRQWRQHRLFRACGSGTASTTALRRLRRGARVVAGDRHDAPAAPHGVALGSTWLSSATASNASVFIAARGGRGPLAGDHPLRGRGAPRRREFRRTRAADRVAGRGLACRRSSCSRRWPAASRSSHPISRAWVTSCGSTTAV